MFISSSTALDMFSKHAPRPWCKKLLAHMIYQEEINVYFSSGVIAVRARAIYEEDVQEYSEVNIQRRYQPEPLDMEVNDDGSITLPARATLIGTFYAVVDEWNDVFKKAPGWLFASDVRIDWEGGILSSDFIQVFDEELSQYDNNNDGEAKFCLKGMLFSLDQIEMYAMQSASSADVVHKRQPSPAPVGRPKIHNWEGALIHLVALADVHGLPDTQGANAAISRHLLQWFSDENLPEPTPSDGKRYARRVQQAIQKVKQAGMADNS